MPSWSALSPRTFPFRFIFFTFLPEGEILGGSFFVLLVTRKSTFTFFQKLFVVAETRFQDSVKESAVFFVGGYVEVDAVVRFVCEFVGDHFLDEGYYFGDVFGYTSHYFR